ncbi:hypothetical protein APS58_p00046 (plasmid) [Paracidovorax citrulli]|nr:hypothetical protein APS58_p00046 [Paracidovorax citrulli]
MGATPPPARTRLVLVTGPAGPRPKAAPSHPASPRGYAPRPTASPIKWPPRGQSNETPIDKNVPAKAGKYSSRGLPPPCPAPASPSQRTRPPGGGFHPPPAKAAPPLPKSSLQKGGGSPGSEGLRNGLCRAIERPTRGLGGAGHLGRSGSASGALAQPWQLFRRLTVALEQFYWYN